MARSLKRSTQKWTYLTWCDLRNHPMMLLGALIGAIAFAIYFVQHEDTNKRIGGVEKTVRVPRRCTVVHLPRTATNVRILICTPATKKEIDAAKKQARRISAKRRQQSTRRRVSGDGGPALHVVPESPNGNPGITPSPQRSQQPSSPSPSRPQSGGGSSPSKPSQPPARGSPPGITTPSLGPIPSLTVPLPNPSLSLPPPPSRQLTG